MITLVIPSKTDAHLRRLLISIEKSQPGFTSPETVIVADNGISAGCKEDYPNVRFVTVPGNPFNFAQAVNLGIAQAPFINDIVVVNDDTEILSDRFADKIEAVPRSTHESPLGRFGVITPKIVGGAGNTDMNADMPDGEILITRKPVCFIFAIIRRSVLNKIGALDERFTGYGWEDTDLCRRAVESGYSLGVVGSIAVRHGYLDGSIGMSGTFRKQYGERQHTALYEQSKKIFEDKWGDGPQLGAYENALDVRSIAAPQVPELIISGPLFDGDIVVPVGNDGYPLPLPLTDAINQRAVTALDRNDAALDSVAKGARPFLADYATHERFLNTLPPPKIVEGFARDTDIEMDTPTLWSLTALMRPKVVVELGTRQAVSTRALAHAAHFAGNRATVITVDPDGGCRDYLQGIDCQFIQATGEQYLASFTPEAKAGSRVDVLFIDTDPHTYEQTLMWLNTWVREMMAPGGVVAFHDIIQNRTEIQVKEACRDWVRDHPTYRWVELPYIEKRYRWPQGGLGLLWVPQGE